jgi:hypothetical protein
MTRVDWIRIPAGMALGLSVLVGLLAFAGCSEPAYSDKSEDPALKASMQKSLELYKAKSQATKGPTPGPGPMPGPSGKRR